MDHQALPASSKPARSARRTVPKPRAVVNKTVFHVHSSVKPDGAMRLRKLWLCSLTKDGRARARHINQASAASANIKTLNARQSCGAEREAEKANRQLIATNNAHKLPGPSRLGYALLNENAANAVRKKATQP